MNSFLSYLGGKSLLANRIIERMPPHACYCEVFAGGAWVLFKKEPSRVEMINDINSDLVTLYRVVQNHLEEFIRQFKSILMARDEFDRRKLENPETLTDIQRAARFYYLLRNAYGGKVHKPIFNIAPSEPPRMNLLRIEEELSAAHIRLARVYIENMSYDRLIRRFDRPTTLFYLDPPYYGCEKDYGDGIFKREDFANLAGLLKGLKGKFLLSINDTPEIRDLFGSFRIEKEGTTYMMNKQGKKKVVELLIMNYKK
jgi:DNA adenine methylase